MGEKTGFEKFVDKQTENAVYIQPKSNTTSRKNKDVLLNVMEEVANRETNDDDIVTRKVQGRPKKEVTEETELVVINFKVDVKLKQILENLKYRTHKTTVKGVLLEAIDLLLDKYGIER